MADAERKSYQHQAQRPSSWARLLLATGFLVALLPCLGLVGGGAYLKARQAGAFSRWRSLGVPPGTGVDLVTGDIDVVYVRTASGDLHACRHRGAGAARDCWERAQEPLSVDPDVRFDQRVYEREVQPPGGTVLDSLYVARWYAEDAFETRYVLIEDGTVWKWEYDVGGNWSLLILLAGGLAGMVLAMAAAALMWMPVVLRSLHRHRQ
jgi:hypothetical protein